MKKEFFILSIVLFVAFFATRSYAEDVYSNALNKAKEVSKDVEQRTESQVQGETQQTEALTTTTGAQTQEQENTKQATQNKGEEIKLRISNIIENLLQIAQQIEKNNPGVGSQIMLGIQEQSQSMEKISSSLDNVSKRNIFLILLIGPNYKELKSVKNEIEQNKSMIQNMNQIMNQVRNESDKTLLREQIQVLETQITELETLVDQIGNRFSLFGWLARLF